MGEKIHVRCGKLFQGTEEKVLENHTIIAEDGIVTHIAPTKDVPNAPRIAEVVGMELGHHIHRCLGHMLGDPLQHRIGATLHVVWHHRQTPRTYLFRSLLASRHRLQHQDSRHANLSRNLNIGNPSSGSCRDGVVIPTSEGTGEGHWSSQVGIPP